MTELKRCSWCGDHADYIEYHDHEWGIPSHDERHLFEMLNLEGAQAGLSWLTILRKRAGYRRAFDDFEIEKIARYRPARIEKLMLDPGIVRNRLKIGAVIGNAKAYLTLREEFGGLDDYLWRFVDGKPIVNHYGGSNRVPASTPLSDRLSKDLQRRGFRFVGSTICYAYMQAIGMVDDHMPDCFKRKAR